MLRNMFRVHAGAALFFAAIWLPACGGHGGGATPGYTIEGSVTGLLPNNSVVLENNAGNSTTISVNASFSFSTPVAGGAAYSVTVQTQPTGQTCTVSNASGVVAGANVSVAVSCAANSYTVGGTVSGLLPGNSVSLSTTGGSATVSANGGFTLGPALVTQTAYTVAVSVQPAGQLCTVTNGSGTLEGANVSNVAVACTTTAYTVNATVFGLLPTTSLVLQDNGGDNLTVSNGGTFGFKKGVASRSTYTVTIQTQPSRQDCFVENGTGTIQVSNVTVTVVCPWELAYLPDYYEGQLVAYYLDPVTGGLLETPGSPYSGFGLLAGLAISPNGKYLYLSDGYEPAGDSVLAFAINQATGDLTQIVGGPFATGANPQSLAIDPSGRFLYAGFVGGLNADPLMPGYPSGIAAYTIDESSGSLSPIAGSFGAGTQAYELLIDPSGQFLFSGDAEYSINASTGSLSTIAAATTLPSIVNIGGAALDTGGSLDNIIALPSSIGPPYPPNDLFVYSINASTGAIAVSAGSPYALAANAFEIAVTPNGQFAYLLGDGQDCDYDQEGIYAFSINQRTGSLAPESAIPCAVQPGTSSIAVDPSGSFLYLSNYSIGGISAFAIGSSSGALTPLAGTPFPQGPGVVKGGFSIGFFSVPLK